MHCIVGYSAHAMCSDVFLTKTIKNDFQLTEIKLNKQNKNKAKKKTKAHQKITKMKTKTIKIEAISNY